MGMPWWHPMQPPGSMQPPGAAVTTGPPKSIVGVDVDGDGDNDLVISQPSLTDYPASEKGNIFVLYNPGDGLVADGTGMDLNGWWSDPNSVQALGTNGNKVLEDGTTTVLVANAMKALDIDGDGDSDLVLAFEDKPPAIWVNPGLKTDGIHPTGDNSPTGDNDAADKTATEGEIFTLGTSLTKVSDIALADLNADGRTDIVLASESGFEVILAPAKDNPTAADWKAAGAAAKKVSGMGPGEKLKFVKVADMDNDGYPDIVVAGTEEPTIIFGSADTQADGDYSPPAASAQVGPDTLPTAPGGTGEVLALDVADVDGDGWQDVAVTYASTYKRIYLGKSSFRQTDGAGGWPGASAERFGPEPQDDWKLTSLELVDLNLDGNLDVLYAPECTGGACPAYVALGKSVAMTSISDDQDNKEKFIENQKQRMDALLQSDLAIQSSAQITNVDVTVSPPNHEHAYAGTTNSECRSPGDDFFPVETRITIDFPVIPCTKEDFKECILLDPITDVAGTVDNKEGKGMVSCSYTVDLHRKKFGNPALPPPTPPPPTPPPPSPPP